MEGLNPLDSLMERVPLLVVEERFQIPERGVVVVPDFPVPQGCWKNRSERIVIVPPSGEKIVATGRIDLAHFNIRDPNVSIEKRWRLLLTIESLTKDQIPIGSTILVSQALCDAVLKGNGAEPGATDNPDGA